MQSVTNIFDQLRLSPPIPGPLHKRTVDAADLGTTAEVLAAAKALSSKVVAAVRFSTSGNSRNEIRTGTSTKRSKPSTMRERK